MDIQKYNELKKIAYKICKNNQNTNDLLHDVLLQLTFNETYNALDEKSKVFFFIRTITNQYHSNNSSYHKTYKKHSFQEIPINYDNKDEEYNELPTISWITETLDEELRINPTFWYNHGIYTLYLEHKKLEKLHRLTQIPKYSLRITLKEMKEWLNYKWIKYKKL
jgi:HD superfamily phosphohydrolase